VTSLRWGILGSGRIARVFADAIEHSGRGTLQAVSTRTPDRPDVAERFGYLPVLSHESLIASPEIDAVYIAVNHADHVAMAEKAARAGKHIVCEKPVGVSLAEVERMLGVVGDSGVFFMEAFMYRFHPQIRRAIEIVKDGTIGEVRFIQADHGFSRPFSNHRLYRANEYGGGLLDVGGYPMSIVRLFAGVARGERFANPLSLQGMANFHEVGVDILAVASMQFPGGILAQISAGMAMKHGQVCRIHGTGGSLTIRSPWFGGGIHGGRSQLELAVAGEELQVIEIDDPTWLYEHEVNALTDGVAAGRTEPEAPAMGWADTRGNMAALEWWYRVTRQEGGPARGAGPGPGS
jgi:predicted dehydrogenase